VAAARCAASPSPRTFSSTFHRRPFPPAIQSISRHVGGGGNAVDVDYGSMLFEVSQLDISLDIT